MYVPLREGETLPLHSFRKVVVFLSFSLIVSKSLKPGVHSTRGVITAAAQSSPNGTKGQQTTDACEQGSSRRLGLVNYDAVIVVSHDSPPPPPPPPLYRRG